MRRFVLLLALQAGLVAPASVHAVDGVVEFNQVKALTGGVTPGDAANFPITISQPGSYRLTSNLDVPANTTAILIGAERVRIDLGGFEVRGPNYCSTNGCSLPVGAPGIHSGTASYFLAVVRNGSVVGMSGTCIDLQGNASRVEDLTVHWCGSGGVEFGLFGSAIGNHVSNCVGGDGIAAGGGGAARDNQVLQVAGNGISAGSSDLPGLIVGNRVSGYTGAAVFTGPGTLVSRNALGPGPDFFDGASRVSLGDNSCNGAAC